MSFPVIIVTGLLALLTIGMLVLSYWKATYRQHFVLMGCAWIVVSACVMLFTVVFNSQEHRGIAFTLLGFGLVPIVLAGIGRLLQPLTVYWSVLDLDGYDSGGNIQPD